MSESPRSPATVREKNLANLRCPQCEMGTLTIRHCKRLCESCGYVESCEDNFIPNQEDMDRRAHSNNH